MRSTAARNLIRHSVLAATLCALLAPGRAAAQSSAGLAAADTSSPRATLESFIDTCNEVHARIEIDRFTDRISEERRLFNRRILDCLDTSELAEHARKHRALEVAVCLKEILDRHELPPWDEIPDAAAIEAADDPEQFARWRIPGTRVTIAALLVPAHTSLWSEKEPIDLRIVEPGDGGTDRVEPAVKT